MNTEQKRYEQLKRYELFGWDYEWYRELSEQEITALRQFSESTSSNPEVPGAIGRCGWSNGARALPYGF
jgi:hypothetical protein